MEIFEDSYEIHIKNIGMLVGDLSGRGGTDTNGTEKKKLWDHLVKRTGTEEKI